MYVNATPPVYSYMSDCAEPSVALVGNHINSFHSVYKVPHCSSISLQALDGKIQSRVWQEFTQFSIGLMEKKALKLKYQNLDLSY